MELSPEAKLKKNIYAKAAFIISTEIESCEEKGFLGVWLPYTGNFSLQTNKTGRHTSGQLAYWNNALTK